jgi:NAD-dependent SIR2 family protein deacetylase
LGRLAKQHGAYVIEINPQETPLTALADCSLQMTASEGLKQVMGYG